MARRKASAPKPTARSRRAVLAGGGVLGLAALGAGAFWFIRRGTAPPEVAVVAAADSDVHVDGALVAFGARVREGGRIQAAKGDALILFRGGRSAVLREGASLVVEAGGARVALERGRARFEVRTRGDLPNPFVVDAGSARVDVLGTIFVVERQPTDERVLVAVQAGEVRVHGDGAGRTLSAGEEATVVKGRLGRPRPVAPASLREDREPGLLERLARRAGKLVDDWGP